MNDNFEGGARRELSGMSLTVFVSCKDNQPEGKKHISILYYLYILYYVHFVCFNVYLCLMMFFFLARPGREPLYILGEYGVSANTNLNIQAKFKNLVGDKCMK